MQFLGHTLIPHGGGESTVLCLQMCAECAPVYGRAAPMRSVFFIDTATYLPTPVYAPSVYE